MCFFKKRKAKKEAERLAKERAEQERLERERLAREEKNKQEGQKKVKDSSLSSKKKEKKEEKPSSKKKEQEETIVEADENKARKAVYRVVFDKEDGLWKIKKDGAKRVIGSRKTKEEALKRVQELSENQDSKFVVYKKDGKFQKKANLNLKSTK